MKAGDLVGFVLLGCLIFCTIFFLAGVVPRPVSNGFYVETCSLHTGQGEHYRSVDGYCVYLHHDGMSPDPIVSQPMSVKDAGDLMNKLNATVENKTAVSFESGN